MEAADVGANKEHRARRAGGKADKRKAAVAKKVERAAEGTAKAAALKSGKAKDKDHRVSCIVPVTFSVICLF